MEGSRLPCIVTAMRIVKVLEQGYSDVDFATWQDLQKSEDFRRLVDRGFLSVSFGSGRNVRFHGKCYVGRIICGDIIVELQEKIQGALRCLLEYASHNVFKVERISGPSSDLGSLASLLVRQYLTAVKAYVSRGRQFEYAVRSKVGSLAGGRLDVARTAWLRARGLGHIVAFEKTVITHDTLLNRIVFAALCEVGRLVQLINVDQADLAEARSLMMLFEDCRHADVAFGSRTNLVRLAHSLLNNRLDAAYKDLIGLASVIIGHISFEHSPEVRAAMPRAWFLNLQSLFEDAVRNVFAGEIVMPWHILGGVNLSRPVFPAENGLLHAHPDILILQGRNVVAVGDVKYKNWSGSFLASDMYQLLVHAAAFDCDRSFLVYPADRFDWRYLGRSVTGSEVWLFAVDVRDLRHGVKMIIHSLGLV
ncbi:MAG: hypothetical protein QXI12_07445 [Candidatus Methanomethyliaceae archaeon]